MTVLPETLDEIFREIFGDLFGGSEGGSMNDVYVLIGYHTNGSGVTLLGVYRFEGIARDLLRVVQATSPGMTVKALRMPVDRSCPASVYLDPGVPPAEDPASEPKIRG